jgi:hypothetical protein
MRKPKQLSFADKMNQFNDEFIELEIRIMRDLIRFVDAHKPTRGGGGVGGTLS